MRKIISTHIVVCTLVIILIDACQPKISHPLIPSSYNGKFKSLFNGNDLQGWDGNANWTVVDGAIQGNGGSGLGQSSIWTTEDYDNFRLIVTSRMIEVNK